MTIRMNGTQPENNRNEVANRYFEWMYNLVCSEGYSKGRSWRKLFRLLHETEFVYILEMDGNRADDGADLRYRFAYESGYSKNEVEDAINDRPCSILEMMVALAQRCEEHITDDPESGNRTGKWFFEMIESLGLLDMSDGHFDKIISADILDRFMQRKHRKDGRGGLFTIGRSDLDMRKSEIWYQMMWYLNETIYGRRK